MESGIDWAKLKRSISERPSVLKVFPPKKKKLPTDAAELEEYRRKERERNKDYRRRNPDKVHAREKKWRQENPDKVKAKKKRFYEAHKQDPEWLEAKRARQRAYKQRKKLLRNAA